MGWAAQTWTFRFAISVSSEEPVNTCGLWTILLESFHGVQLNLSTSLYISLHLSTSLYISLPFLESILLYFFRFMCLGAIHHVSLSGLQLQTRCRPKKQLRACATSSNDATSRECWTLSRMEELEALLAQVQSLTQRVLSLEELRMPSMWPDSTRFRSEPIWQEDKHRSERRMTERPCKGKV